MVILFLVHHFEDMPLEIINKTADTLTTYGGYGTIYFL